MRSDLKTSDILNNAICGEEKKNHDRPIGKATVICLPEAKSGVVLPRTGFYSYKKKRERA